jgi:hypothetical protein
MASGLNSEFNYRYQVIGETPWKKIEILKGFLVGRKRAAVLEEVSALKYQAKVEELNNAMSINALPHIILNLKAELLETDSFLDDAKESFRLTRIEIGILERLLAELYEIVEPTRVPGYSDDQMFELNEANEFTVWVAKEIQAEIIATGRPSPAKLRNAMSNPYSFKALQKVGLIPADVKMIEGNIDPFNIQLKLEDDLCTVVGDKLIGSDKVENKIGGWLKKLVHFKG